MAAHKLLILGSSALLVLACICVHISTTSAQIDDWATTSSASMAMYQNGDHIEDLMEYENNLHDDEDIDERRRSLYWKRVYYISYGALSANRVPCPPRSGRSYYTHNCYHARGPAHPYTRGCSCISRCRR